jgi:hypothetical protein
LIVVNFNPPGLPNVSRKIIMKPVIEMARTKVTILYLRQLEPLTYVIELCGPCGSRVLRCGSFSLLSLDLVYWEELVSALLVEKSLLKDPPGGPIKHQDFPQNSLIEHTYIYTQTINH